MSRLSDARLDAYISGKFDWQTLTPKEVKAMAIELRQLRSVCRSIKAVALLVEDEDDR